MTLRKNPFPLIFDRGDEATALACLLFFGLGDFPRAKAYVLGLIGKQRMDGAFPSTGEPGHWGMRETMRST